MKPCSKALIRHRSPKPVVLIVFATLAAAASPVLAIDLLESYRAGMATNADLLSAQAAAQAGREELPMARSQLLPSANLSHSRFRNDLSTVTSSEFLQQDTRQEYASQASVLSLRQPLYRPAAWANYRRAEHVVAHSEAVLASAQAETGIRVAQAYLDLLLAHETLVQLDAQIVAISTQLQAAQRALAAGQGSRTDVDDARARLDLATAKEVAARDTLAQARQDLQVLINRRVDRVRPLNAASFTATPPQPNDLQHWMGLAEQRNPSIASLEAELRSLRREVDRAEAAHKPNVDAVIQRSITDRDYVYNSNTTYRNTQVGFALNLPLYAGGGPSALVRKTVAHVTETEKKLEAELGRLRSEVRKQFHLVRQGNVKIQALEQAEESAKQAVISSTRGLSAGTRTRLDILNAQQQLALASLELVRERVAYLMARVRLDALVAGLGDESVSNLNRYLSGAEIDLSKAQ